MLNGFTLPNPKKTRQTNKRKTNIYRVLFDSSLTSENKLTKYYSNY